MAILSADQVNELSTALLVQVIQPLVALASNECETTLAASILVEKGPTTSADPFSSSDDRVPWVWISVESPSKDESFAYPLFDTLSDVGVAILEERLARFTQVMGEWISTTRLGWGKQVYIQSPPVDLISGTFHNAV